MLDAFGNDKSVLRLQINRAIFQIDNKVSLQDKEELVVVVMFVPVVLALHDPEANNGVVHLTQRLIIPLIGAGFHQSRNVHHAKRWKLDVEVSSVRIIGLYAHSLDDYLIIGKCHPAAGGRLLHSPDLIVVSAAPDHLLTLRRWPTFSVTESMGSVLTRLTPNEIKLSHGSGERKLTALCATLTTLDIPKNDVV
jgi:hypothetical protein